MTQTLKCYAAAAAFLVTIPAAHAGSCSQTMASVQSQVDSAVSTDAVSGTLAASEGGSGRRFEDALDKLEHTISRSRYGLCQMLPRS